MSRAVLWLRTNLRVRSKGSAAVPELLLVFPRRATGRHQRDPSSALQLTTDRQVGVKGAQTIGALVTPGRHFNDCRLLGEFPQETLPLQKAFRNQEGTFISYFCYS